jgi:hypothetical protein
MFAMACYFREKGFNILESGKFFTLLNNAKPETLVRLIQRRAFSPHISQKSPSPHYLVPYNTGTTNI